MQEGLGGLVSEGCLLYGQVASVVDHHRCGTRSLLRSPTIISIATRNEHGKPKFAAAGLFLSKALPVGVVQLSIAAAGHHPHDLHVHVHQSRCTRNCGQKQARVSLRILGFSARILNCVVCSFLGLFWMSARIGEGVASNERLRCALRPFLQGRGYHHTLQWRV